MKYPLLKHVPIRYHLVAACALIAGVSSLVWLYADNAKNEFSDRERQLEFLQIQVQEHKRSTFSSGEDFTQSLPPRSKSDEVVRDMTRFAASVGVQISSLNIHPQSATNRELGRVQYQVRLSADYSATKAWLAELLARYRTLALQELTIHALSSDPLRNDVSASLILYVRE